MLCNITPTLHKGMGTVRYLMQLYFIILPLFEWRGVRASNYYVTLYKKITDDPFLCDNGSYNQKHTTNWYAFSVSGHRPWRLDIRSRKKPMVSWKIL